MATPRFFTSLPLTAHQSIELASDLAHHAIRVLRMKSGSAIVLFDGRGGEFPAQLQIDAKKAVAHLGAHDRIERELQGDITLVQGVASGDKMDWIIEKAVELGARRVIPIAAQRSVLQLSGERLEKRLLHWNRIAVSASEQCGRNQLMPVLPPISLQECLRTHCTEPAHTFFCHPQATSDFSAALASPMKAVTLLVGPEGGWSVEEQALVSRHGAIPVQFGSRVLRTETAGIAMIAATAILQGWR